MLSNKQVMASRLWFLVQATTRFGVGAHSRRTVTPLLPPSYSVRRFLSADQKSDASGLTESSSNVDNEIQNEAKEATENVSELPNTHKSNKWAHRLTTLFNAHP